MKVNVFYCNMVRLQEMLVELILLFSSIDESKLLVEIGLHCS